MLSQPACQLHPPRISRACPGAATARAGIVQFSLMIGFKMQPMEDRGGMLDSRQPFSHASTVPDTDPRPIAFFAHERGDARVRKRIAALQDHGRKVVWFTFHRVRDKPDEPSGW